MRGLLWFGVGFGALLVVNYFWVDFPTRAAINRG